MEFAKYTDNSGMASSPLKIKKDGHTMMPLDIKRELNRKSFLEENKLNLEVKIAELEKQLKPDLFWQDNEPELGFDSAHEAIESMFDDINAHVGSVFTLAKAVKLPSQDYVLTEFDESTGSFEYEALKEQGK